MDCVSTFSYLTAIHKRFNPKRLRYHREPEAGIDKHGLLSNLQSMRFLLLAFVTLFVASCASTKRQAVSSVTIDSILPRYMHEDQFIRIGEYMTGKEEQGKRLILRTNPDVRDGYYFTLILDEQLRRLPQGVTIEGEFHTPKSLDVQTHTFKLPNSRPKTKEIFVGLTGEDWPYGDSRVPSAWRFTLKDANDQVLGTAKSYLWSL